MILLYCMNFLLYFTSEFHKESYHEKTLIVPLIGFSELWHHFTTLLYSIVFV